MVLRFSPFDVELYQDKQKGIMTCIYIFAGKLRVYLPRLLV